MSCRSRRFSPVERQGVNAVERIILGYNWIFREHPTSDFGIDAEVEICDDGVPSGKLLKLQIKSGSSWFREGNEKGVFFRDSLEHFEYWLGHSLPVVLVLYDPRHDDILWVHIESSRVEKTGHGFKILVPYNQLLTPLSSISLRKVAKGVADVPSYVQLESVQTIIEKSQKSVDIASPWLSPSIRRVVDSIPKTVRVRLMVNNSDLISIREFKVSKERGLNIELRTLKDFHMKQMVIDELVAIYGSRIEPTPSSNEILFLSRDEQLVRSINKAFYKAWSLSNKVN